ncbi:MAG TPA: (4Fe-4S)-binding protein [Elusimicrobia bacterium]|nr:(4Fe-4S)-binding protein [Elusimicrobiota bacterium]
MIISVASGKGGTGKTTVAVNLALSIIQNVRFLDCDVEEPNAHLFLKPKIQKTEPVNIPVPVVDETKCNYCGKCSEICEYHAIAVLPKSVMVFEQLCHGCGGCVILCPEKAIKEKNRKIGIIREGICKNEIKFIDGLLNISEPMSPPIIKAVKKRAEEQNSKRAEVVTIIDAPPGTSCPVIESIKGSDYCILVTEPTPFGLNDLILAVEVLRKLKIPFGVAINRSDIGDEEVDKYCHKENIPILMKIPFDRKIAEAYSKGIPLVENLPEYKRHFQELFTKIKNSL